MIKIERGKYTLEGGKWDTVSAETKTFLKKLLEYDPEKRITAAEAMADPWIRRSCKESEKGFPPRTVKNWLREVHEAVETGKDCLEKVVVLYLANDLQIPAKAKELFKALDLKNDGVITEDELEKATGTGIADEILQKLDQNQTGKIEFSEIATTCYRTERGKVTREKRREVFDMIAGVCFWGACANTEKNNV